jgi:hypothetical protein
MVIFLPGQTWYTASSLQHSGTEECFIQCLETSANITVLPFRQNRNDQEYNFEYLGHLFYYLYVFKKKKILSFLDSSV